METIKVTPISTKAKNRFHNLMNQNEMCKVEQNHVNSLFVTSMNNKYSFWIMLDNDQNWMIQS